MTPEATLAFWAKCPTCTHCWPAAYYPLDMTKFARALAKATCPKGCDSRPLVAKQDSGVLQEEVA